MKRSLNSRDIKYIYIYVPDIPDVGWEIIRVRGKVKTHDRNVQGRTKWHEG